MTDERTIDRLMVHLRTHVAELRRLEQAGAAPEEVADRKRLILRLQEHLAYAVRDLLHGQQPSPAWLRRACCGLVSRVAAVRLSRRHLRRDAFAASRTALDVTSPLTSG